MHILGLTGPDGRTHRRACLTDIFREELQSLREKLLLVTQQSELQQLNAKITTVSTERSIK